MMRHLELLVMIAAAGVQTPALADSQTTTDVSDVVGKALTAFGPVNVSVITYEKVATLVCSASGDSGRRDCQLIETNVPHTSTTQKILTASNIRIVSNTPVVFAAPSFTNFPSDVKAAFTHYFNCVAPGPGVTPDTKNAQLQVVYGRTASTQITTGVVHTQTDTIGFNWSNTGGGGDSDEGGSGKTTWGITGSIAVANQNTSSTVQTTGTSAQITRQDSNSIGIPPLTLGYLEYYVYRIGITVPFSTTVTIEADLSPNDKGYKLLSDIMPNSASRTFPIAGTITTEDGSGGDWLHSSVTYSSVTECLTAQASPIDMSALTFEPTAPK